MGKAPYRSEWTNCNGSVYSEVDVGNGSIWILPKQHAWQTAVGKF